MAGVIIQKVESKTDFRAFFEFPWMLYKDDPNWVPPLLSQRRDLLDKQKNPAWRYLRGEYYIARRGEQVTGIIAAFVNPRHNDFAGEQVGWFGAFEVRNDAESAHALLATAETWTREQGLSVLRGPQTFTTHEECGLLVENFDQPVILMPYNPPYYQQLVESAGYHKAMDLISTYHTRDHLTKVDALGRMERIVKRANERSDVRIRPLNPKNKRKEFETFKDLYNAAWAENWGFVPMTEPELDALVESLGQFLDPSMAFFAEIRSEPVGFALAIPNLNEALSRAYPRPGEPEIWTLLKVLWHWRIRPIIKGLRFPLMGVLAEHRNKGVELALLLGLAGALIPSRYESLDSSWVLETNPLLDIVHKIGGENYKRHRIYEKRL